MSSAVFSSSVRCRDAEELLDVYIDGEMDVIEARELEVHLERCRSCADKEERRRHTRQRLRRTSGELAVSVDFRQRLHDALRSASVGDGGLDAAAVTTLNPALVAAAEVSTVVAPLETPKEASRGPILDLRWVGVGALLAASLVGAVSFAFMSGTPARGNSHALPAVAGMASLNSPVITEAVDWHRRAVPIEVAGPDAAMVRDWFADKVNFAVTVPDTGRAARLLGGRLSHVGDQEAAYLLYEANGAKLSVMLFGDASSLPEAMRESGETFVDNSGGYNVAVHVRDGVAYTFTSEMSEERLVQLVDQTFAR